MQLRKRWLGGVVGDGGISLLAYGRTQTALAAQLEWTNGYLSS